ncbi:MAG: CDP-glucose 4,6-dehydratase [Solirubrobacterales bacterium]
MVVDPDFWQGKSVFVTGHTGFKGTWLSLCLESLGARVYGYSLEPPTDPNMYSVASLRRSLAGDVRADIRDIGRLSKALLESRPDVVFHLAAQPLVRVSYEDPIATLSTNVTGTANLLHVLRDVPTVKAAVVITTDKCYEGKGWGCPCREGDSLGGLDPYSASKACAEIVTNAYRHSFLRDRGVAVATARAGNVIGGGDWARDRLVPDILRAADRQEALRIRFPDAVRPWQHVLEPLFGYLQLAQRLATEGMSFAEAWNFGPSTDDARPVRWIVERLMESLSNMSWTCDVASQPYEAHYLQLDSSKALARLNWRSRWSLEVALSRTVEWHMAWKRNEDMREVSLSQIRAYAGWGIAS